MKKIILSSILLVLLIGNGIGQKYFTKNGNISFFSATSLENIKADNNQVVSVLNVPTGELQFSLLIKSFHFKKSLMEEHFNENYMESEKFPKSTFKGTIAEVSKINFSKDGTYPVMVSGDLTMHGVTKNVNTPGNININAGKITSTAVFKIALADYNISIPRVVEANISKTIEITINCLYDQKM